MSAVTVTVQVDASGSVAMASPRSRSNCPAFTDLAVSFARDLGFSPATKGGQPVSAWISLQVQAQRR